MKSISFLVQGSSGERYQVEFSKDGAKLSAQCTCAAGARGLVCKHRINILDGVTDGIVSGNQSDIAKVIGWLAGTNVESALQSVADAEADFERAKTVLADAKKALAAAMRH